MFDSLSSSLQGVFKKLRGYGKVSEKNIKEALREVRTSLLEADVHYAVTKDFIKKVKEQCMGEDVLQSVTPGQQITKRVHDELTQLLGGAQETFKLNAHPATVMLLGLHGSGKTTTAGKLARRWTREGKTVALVACDIRRPAAVEQLEILAEDAGANIIKPLPDESVPEAGKRGLREAVQQRADIVIFDTGGRFQIDEEMVQELKTLQDAVQAMNTVLVLDAAIGQESVHVAESFHNAIGVTGLILTKMDGDARGGAALSVHAVTGCPVLMIGTGERSEDLEPFYPDRLASRILGMGDVVSLVEKAQQAVDTSDMEAMQQKMLKNTFNLQDFLEQIQQMKKLGPISSLFDMMPMKLPDNIDKDKMAEHSSREMKKTEAVILSMTPAERARPGLMNASRRRRIANGSGTEVRDVNSVLKQFQQTQKMTKKMKKSQKKLLRGLK